MGFHRSQITKMSMNDFQNLWNDGLLELDRVSTHYDKFPIEDKKKKKKKKIKKKLSKWNY